jgi:hypothetical protein
MFQVQGTQWNIVLRSTVERPIRLLEDRWDLQPYSLYVTVDENSQPTKVVPPGKDNSVPQYEITIPRSKWNGDPLDGSGETGYIIDFEKVTMYKIEYSWYGAIGAKFYAYVPVGNGEARWVRLHTVIIENQMDRPVLQNPDFKFRYMVYNKSTANLQEPTYIYKYGASYYIDGGDEGTTTFSSVTSDDKPFFNRTPIIGIHAKNKLVNGTGLDDELEPYEGNINLKTGYPKTVSVYSSVPARIDVEEIKVSPDGFHGSKSVSLEAGQRFEKDMQISFIDNFGAMLANPNAGETFDLLDKHIKIIGDGLHNLYGTFDPADAELSPVYRRSNYELVLGNIKPRIRRSNGAVTDITEGTAFNVKGVSYRSWTGDAVPIETLKFKVHFLNPNAKDGRYGDKHFADFMLGFTPKEPAYATATEGDFLHFAGDRVYPTGQPEQDENYWDFETELFAEFTNRENLYEISTNAEAEESDLSGGLRFEQDERIRGRELPAGNLTGYYSALQGRLDVEEYEILGILEEAHPSGGTHRLVFAGSPPPIKSFDLFHRGQNGSFHATSDAFNTLTNAEFTTVPELTVFQAVPRWSVFIRGIGGEDLNFDVEANNIKIQCRELTIEDDYKLTADENNPRRIGPLKRVLEYPKAPLYLFVGMRSNAKINNIIVEQITADGSRTHVPQFVGTNASNGGEDPNANITIVNDPGVSATLPPSAFVSEDRLSPVGYDTAALNPIRDGKKIYSFYCGANKPEQFDLSNIFNFDRNYIGTGLYNNNAIYFRATTTDPNSPGGQIKLTITTREQ